MRFVVTGAPGWLGTEVVRRLHKTRSGDEVRCLTLRGEDTSPLDPYSCSTHPGDVRDLDSLDDTFGGEAADVVFHCAGVVHPPKLLGGARMFREVNAEGTRNILEAARRNGCDHFVYISSNAAQGFNDDPDGLMTEEGEPEPESPYGRSKLAGEEHVRRYGEEHGMGYTILRPCWYYGPRQPERMTTLMRMIQEGNPIVFGDGTNRRSMTYIPALVDAMMLTVEQPAVSRGETYWITDAEPYTTNHIYETIADLLGVDDLSPRYIPGPVSRGFELLDQALSRVGIYEKNVHVAGEMRRDIAADPSKAAEELGYEPPQDLRAGMEESIAWAKEHGQV